MKQHKRLGGDDNLGYFTEWERSSDNGCIYCGNSADTREHTPSKAFLNEPFPENLPTVPACFKCNNGYSSDEEYVSCYLDVLKSKIYDDYVIKSKTAERLEKNIELSTALKEQIQTVDGQVHFKYDEKRLINVLVKLARGHAGYEFDYVNLDCEPSIWYGFAFNMTPEEIQAFNEITLMDKMPDVGARVYNRLCVVEDSQTGKAIYTFLEWVPVQENEYRYNVYFDESGSVCVKIAIGEMLFCIAKLN